MKSHEVLEMHTEMLESASDCGNGMLVEDIQAWIPHHGTNSEHKFPRELSSWNQVRIEIKISFGVGFACFYCQLEAYEKY